MTSYQKLKQKYEKEIEKRKQLLADLYDIIDGDTDKAGMYKLIRGFKKDMEFMILFGTKYQQENPYRMGSIPLKSEK